MKKLIAIFMTVLFVLSMSTIAFADDDFVDMSTVTVTKSYKLIGAGTSPAETFTLQQVGAGVLKDGEAETVPDLGAITGAAFATGAAADPGATANITIALPTYTSVGIYEYTLKEVAGTTAGVVYYGGDIKLVVTVINDGDGKLRVAAVHTETVGAKSDKFENTYSAGTLNISKTVTGNLGDKDKYFKFTVTLTGEEGKTYGTSYAVTGGSKIENGATDCISSTITIGTAKNFYLKHCETISIANLPYGVTYTVVEGDYTGDGYDEANYAFSDTEKKIDSAEDTVAVTNHKGAEVDTGIFLDSLPYVIILGLVVAAGAVMFVKRRRDER